MDDFNDSDVVVVATAVSVEKAEPEKHATPGEVSDEEDEDDIDRVKSTSMRVEQVFKGTLKVGEEMIFAQIRLDRGAATRSNANGTEVRLRLQAPRHGSIAPPGDYMLFVVDSFGVPSAAKFIRLA